jgi:hypothetical protein
MDVWPPIPHQASEDATISTTHNQDATNIVASTPTEAGGPRTNKNPAERKAILDADSWATEVGPRSVKCTRCGGTILLDKRTPYELTLWENHKVSCKEKMARELERTKRGKKLGKKLATRPKAVAKRAKVIAIQLSVSRTRFYTDHSDSSPAKAPRHRTGSETIHGHSGIPSPVGRPYDASGEHDYPAGRIH